MSLAIDDEVGMDDEDRVVLLGQRLFLRGARLKARLGQLDDHMILKNNQSENKISSIQKIKQIYMMNTA